MKKISLLIIISSWICAHLSAISWGHLRRILNLQRYETEKIYLIFKHFEFHEGSTLFPYFVFFFYVFSWFIKWHVLFRKFSYYLHQSQDVLRIETFLYPQRSYRRPLNYRKNVNNLLERDASFLKRLSFPSDMGLPFCRDRSVKVSIMLQYLIRISRKICRIKEFILRTHVVCKFSAK